jgi:TRAP transporter 4TM/12TM fusion protein
MLPFTFLMFPGIRRTRRSTVFPGTTCCCSCDRSARFDLPDVQHPQGRRARLGVRRRADPVICRPDDVVRADGGAAPHRRLEPAAQSSCPSRSIRCSRTHRGSARSAARSPTSNWPTSYHVLSGESLLGIPIQAFADTVIGFLVFGTALMMTGAGKFFINLAFALCGTFRGGAAKVCIFASGLLGMMSGSIISNVLTAGTMTIPVMKKSGFRASYAAAIEACASTGAVLAPPVMGATAFVIAQFLNVGYADVAIAAIIPARCITLACSCRSIPTRRATSSKAFRAPSLPRVWDTVKDGWYYVFVIALLIVMLLYFKRESHAPFYATALLLILNQLFSKDTRWTVETATKFFEVNGRTFVELIGILAGCGLLIGAFSMTGVISSLANDLLRLAGDNALPAAG